MCNAGKPALILPAGKQTDQPFWADIVRRQGLGPAGFLAPKLTPQKFADALVEGLSGAAGMRVGSATNIVPQIVTLPDTP